jgi:hypothetical protein
MNAQKTAIPRPPRAQLNLFDTMDQECCPRFSHRETFHGRLFPNLDLTTVEPRFWGNAKPPDYRELTWICNFGAYPRFSCDARKMSARVTLKEADLKHATRIVVAYHYLHRGRTMAQLPYWVFVDEVPVGVLLYSLPRLSVAVDGVQPMNICELARIWLSPDVQVGQVTDSNGREHSPSVATCAIGKSLRRVRQDWFRKYPKLPNLHAIVSWADQEHHEGKIYRASNFAEMGVSGGTTHGNAVRRNGGRDQFNLDYANWKTRFLYRFRSPLSDSQKRHLLTTGREVAGLFDSAT